MSGDLKNFFQPKTIAIIGASKNPDKVGNILMRKLSSYKGKIIPIHPKEKYKTILDYKKPIDLAIIATPAKTVNNLLNQCGKKKIKSVIIISAGFGEANNIKAENQILNTAKKNKIKILGPNCFGIANPSKNLDTTFANSTPKPGTTAFISQSGALFSYVADLNIGFSGFVSLGNQSMLTFSDFIEYFNKDSKTKKIVLYVEKLKDGKRFINSCLKSKKQIIVVKAGKTEKGSKAAISHTGSLATDFKIYEGAFKQAKVKTFNSLTEAFGLKKQLIKPKTKNIELLGNAGGAIALITDQLESKHFKITKSKDLLGTAQANDYKKALKKYKNPIIILTPQKMSEPEKLAKIMPKNSIACFLGKKSLKNAVKILKKRKIKHYTRCC